MRLESAFMEHAQSYYTQLSRQVRAHRDQLTSSHQELKIRHQFKLGFYAEMRADPNTAIKWESLISLVYYHINRSHFHNKSSLFISRADIIIKHTNGWRRFDCMIQIAWKSKRSLVSWVTRLVNWCSTLVRRVMQSPSFARTSTSIALEPGPRSYCSSIMIGQAYSELDHSPMQFMLN